MATRIQIVFDCADPATLAAFWAKALDYKAEAPPDGFSSWDDWARAREIPDERSNDWAAILDPEGSGPRLYFQRVPEGKVAKNRMHLDLDVGGGSEVPLEERKSRIGLEVARLKTIGASDSRGAIEEDGEYWVRMNDPEGNEFCVQ